MFIKADRRVNFFDVNFTKYFLYEFSNCKVAVTNGNNWFVSRFLDFPNIDRVWELTLCE
jgi:hypothetical protein